MDDLEKVHSCCQSSRFGCMLEYAFYCSVLAFVYSDILVQPGEALSFVPTVVQKVTSLEWIHKITFHCSKCISGQIAFWSYLLQHFESFNIGTCVIIISLSIFFAAFLTKLWQKI